MFKNKVVIITGGSAGIGAATAETFAKESANIVIVGRNEAKLKDVANKCEKLGAKVLTIKTDVSKEDEAKTIVKKTIDKFGKLDVLVNNAGILRAASVLDSHILAAFDEVMRTNVRSVVQLTQLAAPYLQETKGNIVNVSSVSGIKVNLPGGGPYCMSKAALDHFTRASAFDLAPSGVRVNSVNPGPVITDMQKQAIDQMMGGKNFEELTALGRVSEASEVGDLILFLASEKARSITGSVYVIDNGLLLK